MKRLFLSLLLSVAITSVYAQANSLIINNNIGCDVYLRVFGDVSPSCNAAVSSSFITLAAGASFTYSDPSLVPGLPLAPTDNINAVEVYTSDPSCTSVFSGTQIGEPCVPAPGTSPGYFVYDAACNMCWAAFVTATWTITGTTATVDFN